MQWFCHTPTVLPKREIPYHKVEIIPYHKGVDFLGYVVFPYHILLRKKTKKRINEILAAHTERPLDQIEKDTDRDYYLAAAEAKEYGLIDNILVKRIAETKKVLN